MARKYRNKTCTQNCSKCNAFTTIHKSGLCKDCRSKPCHKCGTLTISITQLCTACGGASSRNHIKKKNQSLRQALFALIIFVWPTIRYQNGSSYVSHAGSSLMTQRTGEIAARNADKRKRLGGSNYDLQDKDQFEGDV